MTDLRMPPLPSAERLQELLFDAARIGRTDMIAALLQAGAEVGGRDQKGYTPLILASYHGHLETTRALIEAGASVDAPDLGRGNTALMGCAFKGYDGIAKLLVEAGASVNARNTAGQTALMMASMFARASIVELLLATGADRAATDFAGNTAHSVAIGQGNASMGDRVQTA